MTSAARIFLHSLPLTSFPSLNRVVEHAGLSFSFVATDRRSGIAEGGRRVNAAGVYGRQLLLHARLLSSNAGGCPLEGHQVNGKW